jgi:hypothetical protein
MNHIEKGVTDSRQGVVLQLGVSLGANNLQRKKPTRYEILHRAQKRG